jgi:small conductance mechanosensitive channel
MTAVGFPVQPASDQLTAACGASPGIACRLVWDISHSTRAAELTRIYFAGPVHLTLRIGLVLLLALICRAAAQRTIGRITARAREDSRSGQDKAARGLFRERRQQRATALNSILRNAASITIFSIALVIIVGDMGLNLAPVLASAGVLGVAIGFGAQNLVKDFLAGIFMLLEDQYGVGDVIDIGTVSGTVEAVSLRITRMRDVNGVVWYVRNGTIKKAGNESQGWARAVVDFPISYERDVSRVRELMQHAAAQLWLDPSFSGVILEAPEVWGIQELSSQGVVMRVTAKTVPLRQWEVARELRERLKRALDGPVAAVPASTAPGAAALPDAAADVGRDAAASQGHETTQDDEPTQGHGPGQDDEPTQGHGPGQDDEPTQGGLIR